MDNLLTPNKIQRLINLAEDRSFTASERRVVLTDEDLRRMVGEAASIRPRSPVYETSSGILDLDRIEGFGESGSQASMSLRKSTTFNPGEITGRSTGASDASGALMPPPSNYLDSMNLGGFISRMQQQTKEVNDVLRQSLASNCSFHSKRDLTADEASLIAREAPLPVANNTQTYFQESMSVNNSNLSVGAYFKNKCQDFGKILGHTESPDKYNMTANTTSMMPSISEVSSSIPYEVVHDPMPVVVVDDTLDTVPVKQPASARKIPEKSPRKSKLPLSQTTKKILLNEPSQEPPKAFAKPVPRMPEKSKGNQAPKPTLFTAHKSFMHSSKPADVLLKNLHSSFVPVNDDQGANDTEVSLENSVSISKIADYLGRQSEISVTDVMKLNKGETRGEFPLHTQLRDTNKDTQVTYLIDTKKTETASSIGTPSTLVTVLDRLKIDPPKVIVTQPTPKSATVDIDDDGDDEKPVKRSQSPSKSPTTLSTVRDCSSFRSRSSGESADNSNGEPKRPTLPSSNVLYKELDKSVDWQDVFQQKRLKQRAVDARGIDAQDTWADIVAHHIEGFVGVSCPAIISVTTHTDSWLTAVLRFDELPNPADLNIELSRIPVLLSPGKCETFNCQITANIEMVTALPFTVSLKDATVDGVIEQKGEMPVKFVAPTIQARSADGKDKLIFPTVHETASKSFVLISDCPVDLQLKLSIAEGDSIFSIKSVQEISKSDVEKVLSEGACVEPGKRSKNKCSSMQLCRLASGKALRVVLSFGAPKLADLNITESEAAFQGVLKVNLITSNIVLKRIKLLASVGVAKLVADIEGDKVHVTSEPSTITLANVGSAHGSWSLKYLFSDIHSFPFKIHPSRFELPAGGSVALTLIYTGPDDWYNQATLRFKEATSGHILSFDITGGSHKPKSFPLKTTHTTLSWVRPGRKEINFKNNGDKRVHVKCNIQGQGFHMDMQEGTDSLVLSFEPQQCRSLPIVFRTTTSLPCRAELQLFSGVECRKISLYGCNSGEAARWSGLMTYASTALVQAAARTPIDLQLYNKSHAPAFVAARVKYDLQFLGVEATSRLVGGARVVAGRARYTVSLHVDWAKVERRRREGASAGALATVVILTGAEYTRRRILRVLKQESENGEPDLSLLPEYLKVLAEPLEGEDANMESLLEGFHETKASLPELISGLHELTAHVELPQEQGDENTIIIFDETLINHHTLAE